MTAGTALIWYPWTLVAAELEVGDAKPISFSLIDPSRQDMPEGIALDVFDGGLYVANRYRINDCGTEVLVSEILKRDPDGRVSVFASLPPARPESQGVLGLTTDGDGDVYAAFASFNPATSGFYRFRRGGQTSERLPGSESMMFPNSLTLDDAGNLFTTDSIGAVWRFRPEERTDIGSLWLFDDLLSPLAAPVTIPGVGIELDLPGANGIAFTPGQLLVANTEKGLLVRVPIEPGANAGSPEVVAGDVDNPFSPIFSIDGIAADIDGNIHTVVPGFGALEAAQIRTSPVVMIDPQTGGITPTVTDRGLAFGSFDTPLSLAFGTLPGDEETAYVTNGAVLASLFPDGVGPGVVQVGVGVPGFSPFGENLRGMAP